MENCSKNAILQTIENISSLHSTSADLTSKFSNALDILKEAQEASDQLINCLAHQSNKNKYTLTEHLWQNFSKDDTLFITVKSTLLNNGTFWCRVWDKQQDFDDSNLERLSTELSWLEKEISVIPTEPKPSSNPVFFYSREKHAHCRVVVEKMNSDSISVRHLDLGISEDVSIDVQFYMVPPNIIKKYPFQSLLGRIRCSNVTIPYEVKWKFNDLTSNQVLFAKIEDCAIKEEIPCFLLSIKSLVKEESISQILDKQIAEAEKNIRARNEMTVKVTKPSEDDKENDEPVRQNAVRTTQSAHNKTKSNEPIKDVLFRPSRSRGVSVSSYDAETEVPSRCNSLDSIVNAKQVKSKIKRSHAERAQFSLYSDKEGACEKPPQMTKSVNKERSSDALSTDQGRHSPTGDWVSNIPIKDRQDVPRIIPNLQNLFYNSTQLRNEPWWEIELMNINQLLNTQANLQFYCLDLFRSKLEYSIRKGELEHHIRNKGTLDSIERASSTFSQYILLRELRVVKHGGRRKVSIVGIAKLVSGCKDLQKRFPVIFLSLSRFKSPMPEFEYPQNSPIGVLSLQYAKRVLQSIRSTLANNQRIPCLPEYYPWCGVPPLMDDFKKPSNRKKTQKKSSHSSRKENEREGEMDEMKACQDALDLENTWAEEDWECNDDGESSQNVDKDEIIDSKEDSSSTMVGEKVIESVCDDDDMSTNVLSPLDGIVASPSSNEQNNMDPEISTGDEICEQPKLDSNHNIENGFYDVSGVWYPSIVAKIVADTISQQLASNENVNSPDNNQNFMSSNSSDGSQKVRILQRPKSQKPSSSIPVAIVEEKILKQTTEQSLTSTDDKLQQQSDIQDEQGSEMSNVQQPGTPPIKEAKIATSPCSDESVSATGF